MARFSTILDFYEKSIQIDGQKIAMRPNTRIGQGIHKIHRPYFEESDEPESTKAATKCTVEILNASYENADLPKVIVNSCKHLSHTEQSKLLKLLKSYEELLGGSLGDFYTKSISL